MTEPSLNDFHNALTTLRNATDTIGYKANALRSIGLQSLADKLYSQCECIADACEIIQTYNMQQLTQAVSNAEHSSFNLLMGTLAGIKIGSKEP